MDQNVNSEIVDKVKKLLKHHAGALKVNSEQEAMTALDMARKLIRKHNLDMMLLQEQSNEDEEILQKNVDKCSVYSVPVWLYNIINTVNNICLSSCILQKDKQPNGYIHTTVVFISKKNDIDHVFQVYMFLKKTTYKLANKHVKEIHGNTTNWRSFAEGFTSRLLERSNLKKKIKSDKCVEDLELVDSEDDLQEEYSDETVEQTTALEKYDECIREKIKEYINSHVNNVQYETVNKVSKVLSSSYNKGREMAETTEIGLVDKSHQLSYNQKGN